MYNFISFWCTWSRHGKRLFCVVEHWHTRSWIHKFVSLLYSAPRIFIPATVQMVCAMTHSGRAQVHKTSWYMLHYGGPTPKRHYAFANTHHIDKLNLGQLRGWLQKKEALKELGETYDLVDKYVDASGQPRWKGNKRLRSSESHPYFSKA